MPPPPPIAIIPKFMSDLLSPEICTIVSGTIVQIVALSDCGCKSIAGTE